jgi:hypothetical protein
MIKNTSKISEYDHRNTSSLEKWPISPKKNHRFTTVFRPERKARNDANFPHELENKRPVTAG